MDERGRIVRQIPTALMSADKRWRLVCYDIRDPARWRKVYKIVRGRGTRVQYSVFRCSLDSREVEQLRWELSRVMDSVDALLIVDLCPTCASNVISRNHVDGWQERVAPFRLIGAAGSQAPAVVEEDPPHEEDEPSDKPEDPGA
jgi:CRISPR-associated protein Cas2